MRHNKIQQAVPCLGSGSHIIRESHGTSAASWFKIDRRCLSWRAASERRARIRSRRAAFSRASIWVCRGNQVIVPSVALCVLWLRDKMETGVLWRKRPLLIARATMCKILVEPYVLIRHSKVDKKHKLPGGSRCFIQHCVLLTPAKGAPSSLIGLHMDLIGVSDRWSAAYQDVGYAVDPPPKTMFLVDSSSQRCKVRLEGCGLPLANSYVHR